MEAHFLVALLLLVFCTWKGEAQVQCYRSVGCPDADAIAQYPTALECCMMDEALSYDSGSESCIACVAYGWKVPLPLEVNKGDVLTLNVGFIKGSSPGRILFEVEFDDEEVEVNDTRVVLGGGDAQVILKVLDDGQVLLTDKIISVFLTKTAGGTTNDILVSEATLIIRAAKVNVGFNETAITVKESSGKATVCLSAKSINPIEVTVAIESTPGGTATERDDYQLPSLVTLQMSANTTACVDVALIVHDGYEGPDPETYSLLLTTTNSSVNIVQSTITISILDTDMATIVLEPEREVVTEGDEEVKQVCLQITNSAIDVGVSFPDALLRDVEPVGGTEVLLSANESVTCVKYIVKDDDEFEGTEEITVTWRGLEPHLETGVKPATFTLVIEDNEQLGIRLVDGPNAKSGLVEVLRSDWRSVCDDYWTEEDANVVCRQLGFLGYGATTIRTGSFQRTDLVQYWLDDVHCQGDESTLFDCRHRGWGRHNCRHNERAGVNCLDKSDIDIRLANDSDEEQTGSGTIVSGAIELRLRGEWRSLCCNHWAVNDAQVACRDLSFLSDGATITAVKAEEGIKYWLDNVNCEGDEESLFACDHTSFDGDECNKGFRAGVTCFEPL